MAELWPAQCIVHDNDGGRRAYYCTVQDGLFAATIPVGYDGMLHAAQQKGSGNMHSGHAQWALTHDPWPMAHGSISRPRNLAD